MKDHHGDQPSQEHAAEPARAPSIRPLPVTTRVRQVSLNEEDSKTVRVSTDDAGNVISDCTKGTPFGPRFALLGTVEGDAGVALRWDDPITENPGAG